MIQKFSDPPLTSCTTCGGPVHKLPSTPAIQFKGTGWYITDYARKTGGDGAKPEGSSEKGAEGSGEKPSTEKPASDKPVSEKPASDKGAAPETKSTPTTTPPSKD